MRKQKEIIIYTDGACSGNPGPGGWAAVMMFGDNRKEISGGFRLTTNNRMELTAAIEALKSLKTDKYKILLHTDSRLIVDAFNKGWIRYWSTSGWRKADKKPVLNQDLWELLWELYNKYDVKIIWVEGHAGIEENERCDKLCRAAAENPELYVDEIYESSIKK
ncbi:MAG: ribonuclease [Bacteroidota bacterium]|nr:ribonuclease [Bacteroidota bacterium]